MAQPYYGSPFKPDDPRNPSSSYRAVEPSYRAISAVLAGAESVRAAGESYLPKYAAETVVEYGRRLAAAPWRPEFEDALRAIASKPFSKPVSLQGTVPASIQAFAEDVDTLGNNLHVFASQAFWEGVSYGLHGILVDYPTMESGITLADERRAGTRPYWCHVPADALIALYTEKVAGQTIVTHVRIHETVVTRDGFGERAIQQVRVLEPGLWQIWRADDRNEMVMAGEGPTSLDRVPLALFYTGKRQKAAAHVRPPLLNLADMQLELYRALSRQEEILTFAGSPMLKAVGLAKPDDGAIVEVGPKRILFAPNTGTGNTDWDFIQPAAANIDAVARHVEKISDDMRRLGLQPLLPRSGDLTATVGALEAAKAHSAVESWANALQDTLEQAFLFTAEWLGEKPTAEVSVHTDFGVEISGSQEVDSLSKMQMSGQISKETLWDELLRRGTLGPQFTPEIELDRLEQEMPDQPVEVPPVVTSFAA